MPAFPFQPRETPLIFERSREGRPGTAVPKPIVAKRAADVLPAGALRAAPPGLPEVPEFEVVRHYIELSLKNHHVDRALYPLGSCTMKYNPKVNEDMARLPGFAGLHPMTPDSQAQGALALMHELGEWLKEIAGMDAISLQPSAGAQGEMTGIFLIAAYHRSRGDTARKVVIIPDSAHGTNPATAALAGFTVRGIKSNAEGLTDLAALKAALGPDVAALMLTNPSTIGRFETQVVEVAKLVHDAGALLYMDGANMNALIGIAKPGDFGVDVMHFNLHKTFSTPHGGGGPGSGPVAVKKFLEPFLPVPIVVKEKDGRYRREWARAQTIGKLHGHFGNFGVMVRAYTYIMRLGREGIKRTAQGAVLNANYLAARIEHKYPMPYGRGMHECVATGTVFKPFGIKTLDIAKRLLDCGYHAPTVYFPLIVPEALMIEPTETETKDDLDRFADTMLQIADEAEKTPELLTGAPRTTPVSRFDEAAAARTPNVRWKAQ
jgi:glycine dehydrogenase subunit 2